MKTPSDIYGEIMTVKIMIVIFLPHSQLFWTAWLCSYVCLCGCLHVLWFKKKKKERKKVSHGSLVWLEAKRQGPEVCQYTIHRRTDSYAQADSVQLYQTAAPLQCSMEQARQCRWCRSIVNNRLGMFAGYRQKQLRMYLGMCFPVHWVLFNCSIVQLSTVSSEANLKVRFPSLQPSHAIIHC